MHLAVMMMSMMMIYVNFVLNVGNVGALYYLTLSSNCTQCVSSGYGATSTCRSKSQTKPLTVHRVHQSLHWRAITASGR